MTEKSYFFDGATYGDAQLAPYTGAVYSKLLSYLHLSDISVVFDEYPTNSLAVAPNAGMVLDISAGKAFIKGVTVPMSADQVTIPGNVSGYDRIDRIVLRVDWNTKTATFAVKSGFPSIVPQFPDLVQIPGDICEMSLARVYVPNGLAAVTTSHIIDEREFIESSSNKFNYANENFLVNSEFIASAETGDSSPVTTGSPAYWKLTGCECYVDTKFDQMGRGTTIRVGCTAGSIQGISTTLRITNQITVPVTIRMLLEVRRGYVMIDTIPIVSDTQGLIVPPTDGPVEVIIRTAFSAADPNLELFAGNYDSGTCIFKLGQVTVSYGYAGAAYSPVPELLIFGRPVNQTGKTLTDPIVGPGVFDLSYDMNESEINSGAKAALVQVSYRDSGSVGGACSASIDSLLLVDITSHPNSALRNSIGFIYFKQDSILVPDPPRIPLSVQAIGTANIGITYIGLET